MRRRHSAAGGVMSSQPAILRSISGAVWLNDVAPESFGRRHERWCDPNVAEVVNLAGLDRQVFENDRRAAAILQVDPSAVVQTRNQLVDTESAFGVALDALVLAERRIGLPRRGGVVHRNRGF